MKNIDFNLKNLKRFNFKNFKNLKNFKDLFNTKNNMELVLFVLLIIYILFNIKTPSSLVPLVDNTLGNIIVLILAVSVLLCCNPILGILAFVAAYIFIQESSHKNPDYAMNNYLPSEKIKAKTYQNIILNIILH